MKGKKEDKMLRELFRQKLEDAEVMPSPDLGLDLLRQVGRKEFLRFNPSRFNIWYAGAMAVAAIVTAVVLLSGSDEKVILMPDAIPVEEAAPAIIHESEAVIRFKEEREQPEQDSPEVSRKISTPEVKADEKVNPTAMIKADNSKSIEALQGITSSFPEGLFPGSHSSENSPRTTIKQAADLFETSVTDGCIPLKVRFISKVQDYKSYSWSFGDGGSSSEKDPEWIFDAEGNYTVTLQAISTNGLRSASSAVINVHPRPVARFEITSADELVNSDKVSFHNYSTGGVRFSWSFGDGSTSDVYEPVYSYQAAGDYNVRLVVTSEYGCKDTVEVMNAYTGSQYFIEFPNAFIPNPNGPSGGYYSAQSDEAGLVFHPGYSGVSDYQLRIFSRRGVLIFESNDINIGWDGYYKGQLSEPGVYIWKVRGSFINGEPFTKMGDLTLFRH